LPEIYKNFTANFQTGHDHSRKKPPKYCSFARIGVFFTEIRKKVEVTLFYLIIVTASDFYKKAVSLAQSQPFCKKEKPKAMRLTRFGHTKFTDNSAFSNYILTSFQ